jgi:hypothetical protein
MTTSPGPILPHLRPTSTFSPRASPLIGQPNTPPRTLLWPLNGGTHGSGAWRCAREDNDIWGPIVWCVSFTVTTPSRLLPRATKSWCSGLSGSLERWVNSRPRAYPTSWLRLGLAASNGIRARPNSAPQPPSSSAQFSSPRLYKSTRAGEAWRAWASMLVLWHRAAVTEHQEREEGEKMDAAVGVTCHHHRWFPTGWPRSFALLSGTFL